MLSRLKTAILALLRRSRAERELDEELRYHIERQTEQNVRLGMSPGEARRAALKSFGGVEQAMERSRDARGVRWLEEFWQDLRYGARMLVKAPNFTLIAVITLALGIGANTMIFSVVNAVLLRPLPYDKPEALVSLAGSSPGMPRIGLTELFYIALRNENKSFTQLAMGVGTTFTLTGVEEPEAVTGARVSANYFDLLGARMAVGRGFAPEEDLAGKSNVVVLSHYFWQRRFGGNPNIIGQPLTLGANSFKIIGVLPSGFSSPLDYQQQTPVELWIGYGLNPANPERGSHVLTAIARLRDGATPMQAQAEVDTILGRMRKDNPQVYPGEVKINFFVTPLHRALVGDARSALLALLAAVIAVLLIACANIANLLLARGESRATELAVRIALGASPPRIIRQLLTESLLLAAAGGAAGLLLARLGLTAIVELSPENIPRLEEIGLNNRVLLFALLMSLLTGLVFGLAPAFHTARTNLHSMLKESSRTGGAQSGRTWMRNLLVIGETALAMTLLIGAGLLLRSFWQLQNVKTGFNPTSLLTMRLIPQSGRYQSNRQVADLYESLMTNVGALPRVQSVAVANFIPLSGGGADRGMQIEGIPLGAEVSRFHTDFRRVSPTYFATMELRLDNGRYFTDADTENSLLVTIVNETLARRHWPNENPLGKRLRLLNGPPDKATAKYMTVVGVVEDAKNRSLSADLRQEVYLPLRQQELSLGGRPQISMALIARTTGDPTSLTKAIRQEVWAIDRDIPITQITTMEQLLDKAVGRPRFNAILLALFAFIALSLGTVGVYGVVSYTVTQRTREIGVRLALGAQTRDVLKLVVRQGMTLSLIGIAIGLLSSFALTRLMATLLFGVSATDPLTFALIAVLLTAVALSATLVPARRAMKVDPLVALRTE